jgi:hypothetical protein
MIDHLYNMALSDDEENINLAFVIAYGTDEELFKKLINRIKVYYSGLIKKNINYIPEPSVDSKGRKINTFKYIEPKEEYYIRKRIFEGLENQLFLEKKQKVC